MITLTNNFHNSEVQLRAQVGQELTPAQVRRARKALCGLAGCTCGGALGERGPQDVAIEQLDMHRIRIQKKETQS